MVNFFSRVINDPARRKKWMIGTGIGVAALIIIIIVIIVASGGGSESSGSDSLNNVPLVDGYNNLAALLRKCAENDLSKIKFNTNLSNDLFWGDQNATCRLFSDIPRLKEGKVGTQVWYATVDCDIQYKDGVQIALEQIDVLKRLIHVYKDDLKLVTSVEDLESSFSDGKIGSIIALNGGHLLDSRLAVLRMYYDLGVRILKLAPSGCYTPWLIKDKELSDFGHSIIKECIRLGIILDVGGLDKKIQNEILEKYSTPVIVSQMVAESVNKPSDASLGYADDQIKKIASKNGLMMVTFDHKSLTSSGSPGWEELFKHLDHIEVTGSIDSVGLASGFGLYDMPFGLMKDVSQYPNLFDNLKTYESKNKGSPWNSEKLEKLASKNFQRILKKVEDLRDEQYEAQPPSDWIKKELLTEAAKSNKEIGTCRSEPKIEQS